MSKKISYSGILLGLNLLILLLINIIPINTLFLMGISSLIISIVIIEFGPRYGFIYYIGLLILSFIIMNNKAQWVLYCITFGIYGLIKYYIESDISIYIEYILKLLFANTVIAIAYFMLRSFIYIKLNIFMIIIFNIVFLIYDKVYSSFIDYYNKKLRNNLKIKRL